LRIALVGCGVAGRARADALAQIAGARLIACADSKPERAEALSKTFGCVATADWQAAVAARDVEALIVATATDTHASMAIAAIEAGKHVFCESPIARNPDEAERMLAAANARGAVLAVAATHRFTPAVQKAKQLLDAGAVGDILFLRGWSGEDAWGGVETWYADLERSGGGTLMSNGIALVDLARWLIGEFQEAVGYRDTALWPIEPVEDNAFGLFRTDSGRVAFLHSSWTEWKGRREIEIYGSEGYLLLDLGAGRLTLGRRASGLAEPQEQIFDFSREPDTSRTLELKDFFEAVRQGREPLASAYDGWRAVQMVHAIYQSSEKRAAVSLAR